MPTTPYAKTLISVNSGATQSTSQTVAGASTIQLSGESVADWSQALWEIYGYPPSWPTPAGWSLNGTTGIISSTAFTPPLITLESAATRWGKWLVRLTVNGGTKNGTPNHPDVIADTVGWQVLSPALGLFDVGVLERGQFDSIKWWVGALAASLRLIDTFAGLGGTLVGDVNGTLATNHVDFLTGTGGLVKAISPLQFDAASGTFPAVGVVRFKNYASKTNVISYRHAGGDGPLLQIDGANQYIYLGNETVTIGSTLFLQGYYGVNIQTVAGAFNISTLTGANAISIKNFNNNTPNITVDVGAVAGACNFRFGEGIVATIKQDIASTNVNGSAFLLIAQAAKAAGAGTGGVMGLSGGAGDGAGLAGGVQIYIGGTTIMIETAIVATGRRIVALNRAAAITTTELPANTGDLVTYLGNANTSPTASSVSGALLWNKAAEGLHFAGPSTQFSDYMLAPTIGGSANTQVNRSWLYSGDARTTTNAAVTILTLPIGTAATNGLFQVVVTGRDVSGGTATDGVSFVDFLQYKNVGGTVTAAGTQAAQRKCNDASMAACTLTYSISGTNVLVQVTGLAAVNIDWYAEARAITN